MKFHSPIHGKRARIEIIPLIDIMFFLLASFMMVSLSMTKIENIHIDLPAVGAADSDFGPDMLHVAVDKAGALWVEKKQLTLPELYTVLTNRTRLNQNLPVYIGGDSDTQHGDMVKVLEFVRQAGIQKISFTVVAGHGGAQP